MFTSRHFKPGSAPATLIPRGDTPPLITLIQYDAETYEEHRVERIEEVFACRDNSKVSWINIDGLSDVEMLSQLGKHFGLHPLALEDVLHTPQRPKIEAFENHFFVVMEMAYADGPFNVIFEQISIFFGANFLITIQEEALHDVFDPVRVRLRNGRGYARTRGHDYLAYSLIDAGVDHFFPVLELLGDAVEELEDELLEHPSRESLIKLQELKRALLFLRRNAWPVRELVTSLTRDESGLIKPETKIFLRDCYDHTIQIMDVIEGYRDIATGMMDIYLSSLGMRTNEVMRVLTVVSTIFIPLTFIVGLYGMNFEYMPELKTRYGYPVTVGVMVLLAIGMLAVFRKKKWL